MICAMWLTRLKYNARQGEFFFLQHNKYHASQEQNTRMSRKDLQVASCQLNCNKYRRVCCVLFGSTYVHYKNRAKKIVPTLVLKPEEELVALQ